MGVSFAASRWPLPLYGLDRPTREHGGILADRRLLATAGPMRWRAAVGGTSGAARMLRGHAKAVNAVAFSPDPRPLPPAGSDTTALPWEVPSGVTVQQKIPNTR
jgi:hypothetical protein